MDSTRYHHIQHVVNTLFGFAWTVTQRGDVRRAIDERFGITDMDGTPCSRDMKVNVMLTADNLLALQQCGHRLGDCSDDELSTLLYEAKLVRRDITVEPDQVGVFLATAADNLRDVFPIPQQVLDALPPHYEGFLLEDILSDIRSSLAHQYSLLLRELHSSRSDQCVNIYNSQVNVQEGGMKADQVNIDSEVTHTKINNP